MTRLTEFHPDKLDRLLVQELEIDPRQSSITLSAKLGISPPTVLRRIQRLCDAKAIVFVTAVFDPRALGYQTTALIGIKVQPGKVDATVDALRTCTNVQSIMVTCGRYDIIFAAFFANNEGIIRFVHQELGGMDIQDVETFIILQRVKNPWKQRSNGLRSVNDVSNHSLDELDLKLIKEMELQPRGSITDLSRKLGVSRQTVNTRLKTLQTKDAVRTITLVDSRVFGPYIGVLIFAKVRPGKIDDVVSALTPDSRVIGLAIMSGRLDINLFTTFQDSDEMSEFVRNKLGGISGVTECEVYIQAGLPQLPFTSMIQHLS